MKTGFPSRDSEEEPQNIIEIRPYKKTEEQDHTGPLFVFKEPPFLSTKNRPFSISLPALSRKKPDSMLKFNGSASESFDYCFL